VHSALELEQVRAGREHREVQGLLREVRRRQVTQALEQVARSGSITRFKTFFARFVVIRCTRRESWSRCARSGNITRFKTVFARCKALSGGITRFKTICARFVVVRCTRR
jgi:hypothetical protein